MSHTRFIEVEHSADDGRTWHKTQVHPASPVLHYLRRGGGRYDDGFGNQYRLTVGRITLT